MNPILQMLMSKLQGKNPQAYQFVNQAMSNGGNPDAFLKQMLGNVDPQQRQNLIQQAKSYGCPDNILKQIQNMK